MQSKNLRLYFNLLKPLYVIRVFLIFGHLKPYVLIWFVLIKKEKGMDFSENKRRKQKKKPVLPTLQDNRL